MTRKVRVKVQMYQVDPVSLKATEVGWASDCRTMMLTAWPGLPKEVFNDDRIVDMMRRVDEETGTLYYCIRGEKQPLIANSSYDEIIAEVVETSVRLSGAF